MKTFHCTHCQNLVFFENVKCLNCEHALAYLPDQNCMAALKQDPAGRWRLTDQDRSDHAYKLCANYTEHDICNWAVAAEDSEILCRSCRLTQVIPDLGKPGNQAAWYRLEAAKRRLIYTLLRLKLPLVGKAEKSATGLSFEFLNDTTKPNGDRSRVMTGHDNGPPPKWAQDFISSYASSHPWEDWAECWAHALHMSDTLEIAQSVGLQINPRRADEPRLPPLSKPPTPGSVAFDQMIQAWLSLTYVLNNLSRGLGLPDSYPFVLSGTVIDKLRFVFATMTG